jgi:hypothetical protein
MGAEYFESRAQGKTADEAYQNCKANSAWSPDGYTGNINVKDGYQMVLQEEGETVEQALDRLGETDLVNYKWGPAACLWLGGEDYLFFGWASS